MYTSTLLTVLLGLGSTLAFPAETTTLARRADCGVDQYCADCFPDGCDGNSATIGFRPNALNIGNAAWDQIANVIAGSCYVNTQTGVGSCDPTPVNVTTTLDNGDSGVVRVSLTSQSFPGWAKNLLAAAAQAALQGSAIMNTGYSGSSGGSGPVTATVPSSFSLAVLGSDTETITLGMEVIDTEPVSDGGICSDILTVGSSVAGAAGPIGAAVGIAMTIASVFCDS